MVVSTDSKEIAEVATSFGAEVPFFRSGENSSDHATLADCMIEVINQLRNAKIPCETVCCMYSTSVFIDPDNLKRAMSVFEESGGESLLPVAKYGHPIERSLVINSERLKYSEEKYRNFRTQDLQDSYFDVGQFFIINVESFLKHRDLVRNCVPYKVSEFLVQDIDNEDDWKLAEMKYRFIQDCHSELANLQRGFDS